MQQPTADHRRLVTYLDKNRHSTAYGLFIMSGQSPCQFMFLAIQIKISVKTQNHNLIYETRGDYDK
jgi:hypothetical protein